MDETKPRGRDHRHTKRPEQGSPQHRALTEGAPMLEELPSELAPRAVPEEIFDDIASQPHALPLDKMAKREERIKKTAFAVVEDLERTKRVEVNVDRLLTIIEKQTDTQAARAQDEIEGHRWTRQKWGEFFAVFTSGGLLVAIISALLHYFLGSP